MRAASALLGLLAVLCLCACADAYLIGAWNIQVFGLSKMSDPDVVDVLVDTLKRYDICLIQEIRDSSESAIFELLDLLQDEDSSFELVVGPRLGRTNSKEQYAYLYRSSVMSLRSSYTYSDRGDNFERAPMIAHFETPEAFTFALIGCHVKPDDAPEEIDSLPLVYNDVQRKIGEPNTILMGDFNADCAFVNNGEYEDLTIFHSSTYTSLLNEDTTLAQSSCAYDRLVVTGDMNEVIVSGSAEVFLYDDEFNLSSSLADDVSDHYPVDVRIEPQGFLQQHVFYKNDFRTGRVGAEWHNARAGTTPNGMLFLGTFGVDDTSVELTIQSSEIPKAAIRQDFLLEFQLYVIGVWNGKGDTGPDYVEVEVEGITRFKASFCNAASSSDFQSYPDDRVTAENACKSGAYRRNSLGYSNDAVYRLSVPFRYRSGPLQVVFKAYTDGRVESRSSESWGIDSVKLSFIGSAILEKQVPEYVELPSPVLDVPVSIDEASASLPEASLATVEINGDFTLLPGYELEGVSSAATAIPALGLVVIMVGILM